MNRTNPVPVPTHYAPRRSKVPALISVLIILACAAGCYYLYDRSAKVEEALQAARAELASQGDEERTRLALNEKAIAEEKAAAQKKADEENRMAAKMKNAIGTEQGELSSENGRLTLQLVDEVLFRFGEADLTDQGKAVLSKVGTALQEFPDKQVWVQGHTDDTPISKNNEKFSTNWDLSTARAVTVVRFLQDEVGVEPKRLAAVGFGEFRPVSKKKDRLNRRIEIVLAPSEVSITRK
ncbi:MAG: OmpA family protein [Myxococcota bacterium]|jgi:chemotaxis protein MotB|nr:OmpA family protein [Myxococcota bacterium]